MAKQTSPPDLLSDSWRQRWQLVARLMTLQCADVEWRHGRNRQKTNPYGWTKLETLASRSVCAEAVALRDAERARQEKLRSRHSAPSVPAPPAPPVKRGRGEKNWLRAPNPKDLFKVEFFAGCRARGESLNPASAEGNARVTEAFNALGDAALVELSKRCALLKDVARENRVERKRARQGGGASLPVRDLEGDERRSRNGSNVEHLQGLVHTCRCGIPGSQHWPLVASLNSVEQQGDVAMNGDKREVFCSACLACMGPSCAAGPPQVDYPLSAATLQHALSTKFAVRGAATFRAAVQKSPTMLRRIVLGVDPGACATRLCRSVAWLLRLRRPPEGGRGEREQHM